MRTTVMLEKGLLGLLLKETGLSSNSKAVVIAVEDYLRRRRLKKVLSQCGKYTFHPATARWRHLDR